MTNWIRAKKYDEYDFFYVNIKQIVMLMIFKKGDRYVVTCKTISCDKIPLNDFPTEADAAAYIELLTHKER